MHWACLLAFPTVVTQLTIDIYPPSLLPIFLYCRQPQGMWVFLGVFSEAPLPSNFTARRDWLIRDFVLQSLVLLIPQNYWQLWRYYIPFKASYLEWRLRVLLCCSSFVDVKLSNNLNFSPSFLITSSCFWTTDVINSLVRPPWVWFKIFQNKLVSSISSTWFCKNTTRSTSPQAWESGLVTLKDFLILHDLS